MITTAPLNFKEKMKWNSDHQSELSPALFPQIPRFGWIISFSIPSFLFVHVYLSSLAFVRLWPRSFDPLSLHSFVSSLLRAMVPLCLRSFFPSFFRFSFLRSFVLSLLFSFVPSFLRSFVLSLLRSFVPSFLRSFVPSFLRSFVPSFIRCYGASLRRCLVHSFLFPSFLHSLVSSCLCPLCLPFFLHPILFDLFTISYSFVCLGERALGSSSSYGNQYKTHRCFTNSGLCPNLRQWINRAFPSWDRTRVFYVLKLWIWTPSSILLLLSQRHNSWAITLVAF